MKLSVLVPTLGTRIKEIRRLLDSLDNQSYKDFEIIIVTQDNHQIIKKIIYDYQELDIKQIQTNKKGLSRARNIGLQLVSGEIVLLSDDDCWYPSNALETVANSFSQKKTLNVLLSQIYDPELQEPYKKYSSEEQYINNKLQLMSRSSIEIAYRQNSIKTNKFDERFGLGSEFVCGEEIDFLVNNFEKNSVLYIPQITVFHEKKMNSSNNKQIIAKGAIYGKNFNIFICLLVLFRDLIKKKENNFRYFFGGYNEYYKGKN